MILQDKYDLLFYEVSVYDGQIQFSLTDSVDYTTTLVLKDDNGIDTWELELYMGAFRCIPSSEPSIGVYLQDAYDPSVTWSLKVSDQQFYLITVTEVSGRIVYIETGLICKVISLSCDIEKQWELECYVPPTLIEL